MLWQKTVRTIVRGPWKLTNCREAQPELFNLETDPGEWHNLANAPKCRAIRAELETALSATWGDVAALDERRYQSEERRLAILASYRQRNEPLPPWQQRWQELSP